MSGSTERRGAERPQSDGGGKISFGQEPVACRIIDLSEMGAQIRIDGRRASRNLVGKRASLTIDSENARLVEGRVIWARPAVHGVYLGIALDGAAAKTAEAAQ